MPCHVDIDDQHSQLIDVVLAERRNARAARTFFTRALSAARCRCRFADHDLFCTGLPIAVGSQRARVYRTRRTHPFSRL
jgi:hypothetical protein